VPAFRDRRAAGEALGKAVAARVTPDDNAIVLALPRGGVPVAYEVAASLGAPLDVFVVRKLGVPGHEELAMGAIATGGTVVLNDRVLESLDIPERDVEAVVHREVAELERRQRAYRNDRPLPDLTGRCVVLVDDGLATGSTMRAAVSAVRAHTPARVVVAVPVAAVQTIHEFEADGVDMVVLATPSPFYAVGQAYEDFSQTTDDEVCELLGT
jgi:predicted phosphoribosyltransferase